jgi:hypothetical protein
MVLISNTSSALAETLSCTTVSLLLIEMKAFGPTLKNLEVKHNQLISK